MFVTAVSGEHQGLGIGKLVEQNGASSTVAFFDAPGKEQFLLTIPNLQLRSVTLSGQTRVYYFNPSLAVWQVGRFIEMMGEDFVCRFPNKTERTLPTAEVFVRCNLPIVDPTDFLAERFTETPRFSDGRRAFVQSITAQRAVTMGMSGVLSSAIDFESHQLEVVRRILQDPVQRYMLADEVGLGKTIEAGMLIRQCILDLGPEAQVLVIVPAVLIQQWLNELTEKFFLGSEIGQTVHVVALNDRSTILRLLKLSNMLVIDEAHHLTGGRENSYASVYQAISAAAPKIDRVILLSATPALHNERGFLEMLHILDPDTYRLDDEEGFRKRIANRQALAQIVAGLAPENVFYLDHTLDQLAERFPEDKLLQDHIAVLREVAATLPDESDPELFKAIGQVRSHISEVYRLHRRILRHRRRNVGGLTPDRAGAVVHLYHSRSTKRLFETVESWRADATLRTVDEQSAVAFSGLVRRLLSWASTGKGGLEAFTGDLLHELDHHSDAMKTDLADNELLADRTSALLEAIQPLMQSRRQFVIFCSANRTADVVAQQLARHFSVPVDRHDLDDDAWNAFNLDSNRPFLVCDYRAEEGLNLQGGKKVLVHFDLPFSPNRIEQRLGRVDRYGSGAAVPSLLLVCNDSPYEKEWARFLDETLRVFDRSVASLQYVIEDIIRTLSRTIYTEGPEAIVDLVTENEGGSGPIETEIAAIDQQDALDTLGDPPAEIVEAICDIDDLTVELDAAFSGWVETCLMFERISPQDGRRVKDSGSVPFQYNYVTTGQHTLIPLDAYMRDCGKAVDLTRQSRRQPFVRTYPLSFSRRTALKQEGRAQNTRILRYGEPFTDGIWRFSQVDDRGRSTAIWRVFPDYKSDEIADLFIRFDFIVEPDLTKAIEVLKRENCWNQASSAALKRRGDMALPAFYQSVWLDQEMERVSDLALLAKLNQPYRPEVSDAGGRDYNLNSDRWQNLGRLRLGQMSDWRGTCRLARGKAESELRELTLFVNQLKEAEARAAGVNQNRLGQLRARADRRNLASDEKDWKVERDLAQALSAGILSPSVRVDTVTASFLTGSLRATATVDGKAG